MSEKEETTGEELHEENNVDQSTESTDNTTVEQDPVANLEDEVKDLKDQNLRLYAEFENFRKRTAKERLELMESANKDTLTALLPVLDDFERALKNTEETEANKAVFGGLKLIQNKLIDTLKGKGLNAMQSTNGKNFDVEKMEAITQIPAPTPDMDGKVIDELEKGYKIGDKVIRFAKVVVGKGV